MLLAIDTSTETAGIALIEDVRLIAEMAWRCGQNHSVELLPHLDALLKQSRIELSALKGVVVAVGPGAFNGLRVGVSTAKGLAFSMDIPVVGIRTLEAAAYQHAESGLPVCAVSNAGRGEIAMAVYQMKNSDFIQLIPEHIATVEALDIDITSQTVFCGEYLPVVEERLKGLLGDKAIIVPRAGLYRRAAFLAELGQRRLEAGNSDNPATLQPLYLRRPPITQPKRYIVLETKNG